MLAAGDETLCREILVPSGVEQKKKCKTKYCARTQQSPPPLYWEEPIQSSLPFPPRCIYTKTSGVVCLCSFTTLYFCCHSLLPSISQLFSGETDNDPKELWWRHWPLENILKQLTLPWIQRPERWRKWKRKSSTTHRSLAYIRILIHLPSSVPLPSPIPCSPCPSPHPLFFFFGSGHF